jgi:hypothetical protein
MHHPVACSTILSVRRERRRNKMLSQDPGIAPFLLVGSYLRLFGKAI